MINADIIGPGRPKLHYHELAQGTKKRKLIELDKLLSTEECCDMAKKKIEK